MESTLAKIDRELNDACNAVDYPGHPEAALEFDRFLRIQAEMQAENIELAPRPQWVGLRPPPETEAEKHFRESQFRDGPGKKF